MRFAGRRSSPSSPYLFLPLLLHFGRLVLVLKAKRLVVHILMDRCVVVGWGWVRGLWPQGVRAKRGAGDSFFLCLTLARALFLAASWAFACLLTALGAIAEECGATGGRVRGEVRDGFQRPVLRRAGVRSAGLTCETNVGETGEVSLPFSDRRLARALLLHSPPPTHHGGLAALLDAPGKK